ncbi:putative endo-beta-N-acetylglucosaminidase precursor [Streptococcus mitis]|uniref:Putative endo-beta-N-acetylglucosaminidase n=1 Tax=Streptococcus mitis TaxID=28037 RepID=A0A3R9QFF2_STRMT|nr:putative endo-beta-N-acetylglucosaminidase precursor [Streptococcus mitis]
MKTRSLLVSSLLATSLLGAGVLVAQPTEVHALTDVSVNDTEFPLTLTFVNVQDNPNYYQKMLLDIQKEPGYINNNLHYDIVNEDTGALVYTDYTSYKTNETRFREDISTSALKDGTYHIDMYTKDNFGKKAFGRSVSFKIAGGQFQSFPASAAQRTEDRSPVLTDDKANSAEFPLKLSFINVQDNPNYRQRMLLDIQKDSGYINNNLHYDIVNEDTGSLVYTDYTSYKTNETRFREDISTSSLKNGTYHIEMYTKDDFGKKAFGRSVSFKVAGGQFQSFPTSTIQKNIKYTLPVLNDPKTSNSEYPLKLSFINVEGNPSYSQRMLLDIQKDSGYINNNLHYDIVNEDTGSLVYTDYTSYKTNETRFREDISTSSLKNGTYHIEMYTKDDFGKTAFGRSVAFKVVGGQAQPDFTSGATPTPTQSGWVGSSYYQDGAKVKNKWIFDKNYNSYFYLDASGNYVQNAWVGNYYLKAGGYMAKNEWIFDKNYGSFYYLTSEGSYARNTWSGRYYLKGNGKMAKSEWIYDKNYGSYYYITADGSYAYSKWVGDYYLKGNGKMAVNERTPDGYRVDGSGKWIR